MSEELIWNATVRVKDGPQLTASGVIEVDAYDKVSVGIPAGAQDLVVDLGPGGAGKATCLVILPDKPNAKLTYKQDGDQIKLDQPQFFFGGAVELTGNPASLKFSNSDAADATVQILIGRDATP
jgi:hypothetical protein